MAKSKRGLLAAFMIVALAGLVGTLEFKQQIISGQLLNPTTDIAGSESVSEEKGKELAKEIVEAVRKLIDIPEEVDPTVATIVDVDALRASNPFYNKAENGDHLIVTAERAILYSSRQGKIIDVVPVTLEPIEGGSEE